MKCVMVTNYFPDRPGGIAISANTIATGLAARGHQFEWFASGEVQGDFTFADGVHPRPAGGFNLIERLTGVPLPVWGIRGYTSLSAAIRRSDIVFLHDCLYLSNIVAWVFAKLARKPIVILQHIGPVPFRFGLLRVVVEISYRTIGRMMLSRCNKVVFPADNIIRYFSRVVPAVHDPLLIRHGVDGSLFHPPMAESTSSPRRPRIIFSGRYIRRKGMDIMRQLVGRFPGCDWVFAGSGVKDPSSWGLPNVMNAGTCDRRGMAGLYRSCDMLVLPSLSEAFPLVVQEAMASGLAVLIPDEIIEGDPSVASHVITARRTVDDFAAAIHAHLLKMHGPDDRQCRIMAREFAVRHWSLDKSLDAWDSVFTEVARQASR